MIRVMVVEDYDVIRDYLVEKLSEFPDIEVTCAYSSGHDVIEYYDKDNVDVVLLDIEMEEADSGIKAAESILEINPEMHIVYLTSHDNDSVVITALATGADDFVVKGASIEEIAEHIRASFEGSSKLDSKIQRIVMGEYKRLRESEQNLLFFIKHIGTLTPAEKELISYFLDGLKVKEIASKRFVEPVTVKSQIRTLLQKFHCSRTSEIVKIIQGLGLEHLFVGQ